MFIKRIEIGQFGNLKDFAISFKPDANLIVAPNEWGKSTLIDFIFAVFYGMDRNNPHNLRNSNRSRNMPWGQDSMNGALLFEADGLDYRVSCEFGTQPRLDRIVLTDEKLGKTFEIDGDEPLGKRIFGLGEHSFNQSVYVQQMSLALNVKDDKKGELLHQLANLGTAGTSEISSTAVTSSLNEALLSLSSNRRKNAVIPNLEIKRYQLKELLAKARAREEREAEELLELKAMEAEFIFLADRLKSSERKLQKTEYLIQLQNLRESVREERAIKNQQKQSQKQLEQVEALKPPLSSEEFAGLDKEIKQLQIENSILENSSRNLEIERGAMQRELTLAFSRNESADGETVEELNFNERRQDLRRRGQACDKELRSAYAGQQQKEMNLSGIREELDSIVVPETQVQEKKLKISGFVLTFSGFASALLAGIMWHPAAYSLALIAVLGFYFLRKSKNISSDRVVVERKHIESESRLAAAETDLAEADAEVENLERQLSLLEEKQNALDDEESQIGQRQQEAKIREESYRNNAERYLERREKFCDAVDSLMARYPYLNTEGITEKIKTSQDLPQLDQLEYSTRSLTVAYPAELFQEDSDANKRRYADANKLFKRFADSYSQLNKYVQDLKENQYQLSEQLRVLISGQGKERLLPSEHKQQLLEKAEAENLPVDDRAIAIAIEEEDNPEDLSKSAARQKQELQLNRSNYNQALSEYSKKQAHMSLAYRHSERSENIELRLEELDERIEKAESRARQLELAQKYLNEADEEMRRNFSPELRSLTARYLEILSLGRYDDVLIDTDMKLQLHLAGETQFRAAEYMSGGCYDQVYLALRLALSELITQESTPPLILDDVLVQFDDERMEAALALLAKLSRKKSVENRLGGGRQILLFSCQERVADVVQSLKEFNIQRM